MVFSDVAGVEEAKEELVEVVEFLKYPEKFAALGARIPRGVLLVGPPGTGKTLLSRAVAGEAGVPFFSISGSEFVEMFVGVGASRVRDLFDQAKRNAPCIVFVDEIDAVGRQRGAGLGGSHDEREQTLNQILVEMDGFDSSTNVIVIAATNRPDVLDPALLRPGRFDRQVILDRPDIQGRVAILEVHVRGKPLEEDVSIEGLARQTPGFSGADLENLVNEAAILAARKNRKTVGRDELTEAIDRVIAGPQRKSRVISDRERMMTAYHEAGHALVARMLPHAEQIIGMHPSEALFDARPDIVAGIYMAVALTSWSGVGTGHATTFTRQIVLRPPMCNVAADTLLTQAIIDRGIKIIDAGIEHGVENGFGLRLSHVASTWCAT